MPISRAERVDFTLVPQSGSEETTVSFCLNFFFFVFLCSFPRLCPFLSLVPLSGSSEASANMEQFITQFVMCIVSEKFGKHPTAAVLT